MSPALSDPKVQTALASCIAALRKLADFKLDAEIAQVMHDLGARKEFLSEQQHAELLALLAFSERRTLEKLQAQLALAELKPLVPEFDIP